MLVQVICGERDSAMATFSSRDAQILSDLARGLTIKQIAEAYGVSRQRADQIIDRLMPDRPSRRDRCVQKYTDMVGERHGKLTIRGFSKAKARFSVQCDCGKEIQLRPKHWARQLSCGCDSVEKRTAKNRVCGHGKAKMDTYSRFKGVSFYFDRKLWTASVQSGGQRKYLGTFDNEVAAAHAYDSAVTLIHGDAAMTNAKLGLYTT